MISSQKFVLCLCLLLVSPGVIEAGLLKKRQNEMPVLLAGGLLTLLSRGNFLNIGHNLGHNLGSVFGNKGHGNSKPESNLRHHHQFPGLGHGIGHHMVGFGNPHQFAGLGHSNIMGGLGQHHLFSGFGHSSAHFIGGHGAPHPFVGLGHIHPFSSLPITHLSGDTHNFPGFMHGLVESPCAHNSAFRHGVKRFQGLNNIGLGHKLQPSNIFEDNEFKELFKSLEQQGFENHGAKLEDSTAPQHIEEQKRD